MPLIDPDPFRYNVYRESGCVILSHSHEVLAKTKYMHMLMLYICFQVCSYIQSHIVSIEY